MDKFNVNDNGDGYLITRTREKSGNELVGVVPAPILS